MSAPNTPFRGEPVANRCRPKVLPEWTDYNDHFNVAYYVRAFDLAAEAWRAEVVGPLDDPLGLVLGATTARSRVSYLREVHLGRALEMTTQILAASDRAVVLLQGMHVVEDGYLAAIEERVDTFVANNGAPITLTGDAARRLRARAAAQADIPIPSGWGTLSID